MKSKLFLYLFLFAALYIVFQYANASKTFDEQKKIIMSLEEDVNQLELKVDSLQQVSTSSDRFSLTTNSHAKTYVENMNMNPDSLRNRLEFELMNKNQPGKDNALIPYKGMKGKFSINHIKVLNHRWILAEFTDSVYWGEALIYYFIDEQGNISFETRDAFIYPN